MTRPAAVRRADITRVVRAAEVAGRISKVNVTFRPDGATHVPVEYVDGSEQDAPKTSFEGAFPGGQSVIPKRR